MDTQTLWLLFMSIATPIAGFVGFAIQLRQVKNARLENDKLQLEIAALRQRAVEAERRIVIPTNREVQRITLNNISASRYIAPGKTLAGSPSPTLKDRLILIAAATLMAVLLAYLGYDVYRIAWWLATRF